MECSMSWTEDILVLTLYYSSAISIKRAWTCPILSSIDVTHIHWLPNHISGISNQALVFVRDVKLSMSQMEILKKNALKHTNK